MGLMLASLLVAEGRSVTVADRHPERRAQATEVGAHGLERLKRHALVFEAVGRPDAWRQAVDSALPGGVVVLVGGCPRGTEVSFPTGPIHYDELELRGSFHHSREEIDQALAALATGAVAWELLRAHTISLEQLPAVLASASGGPARKWVVDPRLR
jgi:L-iditol 2-dehydrogenase